MKPLTEREIRSAFRNCTKGEANRLFVPRDLAEQPWPDLEFFGWRDPRAPDRAALVTVLDDRPIAIVLRSPRSVPGQARRSMCAMCCTVHSGGVSLMVAPKAGKAGQQGNSVGTYLCDDLACSHYVRGRRSAGPGSRPHETITLDERIERITSNLTAFIATVTA